MNQKNAQKQLDKWCREWGVPSIPVKVVHDANYHGVYDDINFEILLSKGEKMSTLKHEFRHYLLHLIRAAESVEETICDEDKT